MNLPPKEKFIYNKTKCIEKFSEVILRFYYVLPLSSG